MTERSGERFEFQRLGGRRVEAAFDGGRVTSDAGAVLLREVEERFGFLDRLAACFVDHRDPDLVDHTVAELVRQRVYGLCLGYEDLVDHDALRFDPLLATLVGKTDPEGHDRARQRDRGAALAGKSTLNRLELTPVGADPDHRYKKITANVAEMQDVLVDAFLLQHEAPPERIVLDFDATDDPLHGRQLGRFFHGYYRAFCYLPLYVFCGDHPLLALLRPADQDASAGTVPHLARIVRRIRETWPEVEIVFRGDSGFQREPIMAWCEAHDVHFVIGVAKNERLNRMLAEPLARVAADFEAIGEPCREFVDLTYRTGKSWSRERRVVAKAEHLSKGPNPRYVVTSYDAERLDARRLYEVEYCGRGEMENRIKEQQLMLFADRTSCGTMRANQIRLLLSTMAYVLLRAFREHGLVGTELERAQVETIRTRLLKIGARVTVSVRRVRLAMSSAFPLQRLFATVHRRLAELRPPPAASPVVPAP